MPDLAGVDVEERVRVLVEAHRPQLADLVQQHVDRLLAQLVEAEIAHRNGATATAVEPGPLRATPVTEPRQCANGCGRPAAKHRRLCERCRHAKCKSERAADGEARPATTPTRAGYLRDQRTLDHEEQRRRLIAATPLERIEKDGREWMIRRLPPSPAAAVMLGLAQ